MTTVERSEQISRLPREGEAGMGRVLLPLGGVTKHMAFMI